MTIILEGTKRNTAFVKLLVDNLMSTYIKNNFNISDVYAQVHLLLFRTIMIYWSICQKYIRLSMIKCI
jgi:hypothetical protein